MNRKTDFSEAVQEFCMNDRIIFHVNKDSPDSNVINLNTYNPSNVQDEIDLEEVPDTYFHDTWYVRED